ncbi:MAG: ATP-dependent protease ATPase subunit HslU [Planctomycetes bacterium]|nr:ATP-dependent protease ATPase subunit HslU [Planctomycetota bacterium]
MSIDLTPRRIVEFLDRYIVGQDDAKRAVAVALRNRWRRRQLAEEVQREITPKNIIMIGPTGVGKTEIARRIAQMSGAPFVKVEATRFTEVGYHGRDVETMVRDLVKVAHNLVTEEMRSKVDEGARRDVNERLLDALLPVQSLYSEGGEHHARAKDKVRTQLEEGLLEDRFIEIEVQVSGQPIANIFGAMGDPEMGVQLQDALGRMMPKRTERRRMAVREARSILLDEAAGRMVDEESAASAAVTKAEEEGIIFIDEIDKVVATESKTHGPDVSREGVQRDLLPIVEGTMVGTRYGPVRTDHVLFIAAGAFSHSSPSELLPELQGRFPIRVELSPLSEKDFRRILTAPQNSLVRQYSDLLEADGVKLEFAEEALDAVASIAVEANRLAQNIGARRLHTVMERLLEDVSFRTPEEVSGTVAVDRKMVEERLRGVVDDPDLTKFIL